MCRVALTTIVEMGVHELGISHNTTTSSKTKSTVLKKRFKNSKECLNGWIDSFGLINLKKNILHPRGSQLARVSKETWVAERHTIQQQAQTKHRNKPRRIFADTQKKTIEKKKRKKRSFTMVLCCSISKVLPNQQKYDTIDSTRYERL